MLQKLFQNQTVITHSTKLKSMFKLEYFKGKKSVGQFEYPTLENAQDAIEENDIWNESSSYKIINLDSGDIEEEDEF